MASHVAAGAVEDEGRGREKGERNRGMGALEAENEEGAEVWGAQSLFPEWQLPGSRIYPLVS